MVRKGGRPVTKPFSASTDKPAQKTRIKKKDQDGGNAYTFIQSLPKRHRTGEEKLSLTRDEEAMNKPRRVKKGEEVDSDDDMEKRIRKVAMMIAQEGTGDVESDESDVDSDEAWEEDGSDEERWGDVFRDLEKGKKKKSKSKAEERVIKIPLTVNLDESDEEVSKKATNAKGKGKAAAPVVDESEEDEEEDQENQEESADEDEEIGDDEELDSDEEEGESEEEADLHEEDEDDDEDDEDGDESDLVLPSDLSEDEADPDTLDGLDAFVEKLAEGDKKRKSAQEIVEQPKKRRVLPVVSAPALGNANDLGLKSNQKVDLASLIASHPSLSSASSLLPKSKPKSATNVLNAGTLAAPLPTVVQDRLNREAAYEKTKEEGAKWATMMKRVKEAEHLSFPLQGSDRGGVKSNGEMISSFKPINGHESAIQSLLAKANLTESGVTAAEDEALQGKDLTTEEIAERRAALRTQRELMFREEARQKRVAKIKSKTFRKLARKRAAKAGEAALEDMDEEDALVMQEKMERERAKERATLKHGAKTGRWAREAEHMHGMGEEYRSARGEMLDMQEKLKRRIAGKGDVSDEEGSEGGSGDEEDEESIRRRAFDQLDQLDEEHPDVGEKGLAGMKFMKKAEERKRQAAKEEESEMRRDIEMFGEEESGDDEDGEKSSMLKLGTSGGRMVFAGPAVGRNGVAASAQPVVEAPKPSPNGQAAQRTHARRSPSPLPSTEENPWLAASSTAGPSRKRNTILTANSSSADKSSAALKKAKTAAQPVQVDDEAVEIEVDGNKLLQQKKRKDVGSDGEGEDELLPRARIGFKQRDLVAEAFAGDNVVQDFAQEKQRVIDEDAPKVEDTSLPGWGAWSGKGTKKRKTNPQFLKTTPGLLATDRKDSKFSNVIISEKKDKKASQFQVKDLPYPYTSVEQYEARFKNPLGSEWNSRGVHQRETMPRVTKKKGAIIEPVRRLF